MKTQTIIVLVIIFIVGGLFLTGNSKEEGVVTIGVIAGTTGQYADAGEGYLKGFKLAQEEWNENNSLQFKAVIEDDGFDAVKGLNAYTKLKGIDKVDAYAVLSTFTIDAIEEQVLKEAKPVALGFEQSLAAKDDNIFQVLPAARPVQEELGKHLKELGYKRPLLLVSNNSPTYNNFYLGFVDGFGEGVIKKTITGGINSYRTVVTKAQVENPDVVVFFVAPKDGALISREYILQSGEEVPKFVFDQSIQSGISNYQEVFGDGIYKLNGSLVSMSRNDLTDSFISLYQNKYKAEPLFASDMGYNSFMLLVETYSSSQSKWVNNMKSVQFVGADGEFSFNEVGFRIPNVFFAELKDGEVIVK